MVSQIFVHQKPFIRSFCSNSALSTLQQIKLSNCDNLQIEKAFKIYKNSSADQQNNHLLNEILKICLQSNQCHRILPLYKDIIKTDNISWPLLIKCCIETSKIDKNKTMKLLKHINSAITHQKDQRLINHTKTSLINAFGLCANYKMAQNIFKSIPETKIDIVTIGAMMKCYVDNKKYKKAIFLHKEYKNTLKHNDRTNTLFIKACTELNAYKKCQKFIDRNFKNVNLHSIDFINTVIAYYGKKGDIKKAENIFLSIPQHKKETFSLNVMLNAYNNNNAYDQTLRLFEEYKAENMLIDSYSFCIALHSISMMPMIKIDDALNIFESIPNNERDIAIIAAMMKCFINNEQYKNAINIYQKYDYLQHNDRTNTLFVKSCAEIGDYAKCQRLLDSIQNVNDCSIEFKNTMIDFYGRMGEIEQAENVFFNVLNGDKKRDIISMNAMMNAYNANNECLKALSLFNECIFLNEHSFCIALNSCSILMEVQKGQIIVDELYKNKENFHILQHVHVQCALIAFFAKCDKFDDAVRIFDDNVIKCKDAKDTLSLFAVMMDCYAKMGKIEDVMRLFDELKEKKKPNVGISNNIYCIVLNACAQTGKVKEAMNIFEEIKKRENGQITPHILNAIIDALARANQINEAMDIYIKYCDKNDDIFYKFKISMLSSMLSSCRVYNDVEKAQNISNLIEEMNKKSF